MESEITIKQAVDRLRKELSEDQEFFHAWKANIAMAFKDEYSSVKKKYKNRVDIHHIANKAAFEFLVILIERRA